jgi:hypothetical protein
MDDSSPPTPELPERKNRFSSNSGIKRNKVSRACDECRKRKVKYVSSVYTLFYFYTFFYTYFHSSSFTLSMIFFHFYQLIKLRLIFRYVVMELNPVQDVKSLLQNVYFQMSHQKEVHQNSIWSHLKLD